MSLVPRPLPAHHELKSWPEYFKAVRADVKRFEIRKNDRNFKVCDLITLREWDPKTKEYTGRWSLHEITYVAGGDVAKVLGDTIVFGISEAIRASSDEVWVA